MKLGFFAAGLSAFTLLAAGQVSAQTTEPVVFDLRNRTQATLVTLQIGESTNPEWGEDILGVETLAPGETATVTINDNLEDCQYDLRATFTDGDTLDVRNINMCEINGETVDVTG